jgi:hypothetical protein
LVDILNAERTGGGRRCVVTAYRNPGAPSHSRWINDEWEVKAVPVTELQ